MRSISNLILSLYLLVPACHGSSLRRRRATSQVYQASSNIEWSIYTPTPQNFTTNELFDLENASSRFIISALESSSEFEKQTIYTASLDIKDQDASTEDAKSTINAQITAVYGGNEIEDFTLSLSKAISANGLLTQLEKEGFFSSASTAAVKYTSSGDPFLVATNYNDTILFIILLSFVALLIIASIVMLVASGVLNCCRKQTRNYQDDGIKMTMTDDTAESQCSPVLGARREIFPSPDDSRYDITPVRGSSTRRLSSDTPSSQASKMTEYSIDESTTSANPLGIVRLNTLNKLEVRTQKSSHHGAALYSVSLKD